MIQEYLFLSNEKKDEIEKYKPEKVTVDFYVIDNSNCWIASYSMPGENEGAAKILSDVNEYIISNYSPTVLSNGCSAYFNRMLFPCINEFERKLRKLLYLKSALNKGDKASDNITGLESKDLGDIFTLMFTDDNFVKSVRTTVNNKTWNFTKDEIIKSLTGISESTKWDVLIGSDSVPELKDNFIKAKDYRNDTMHAHNIDAKTFKSAKKLFEKINVQLDTEIGKIIKIAEEDPKTIEDSQFNSELNLAIQELDWQKQLREIISAVQSPEIVALRHQLTESSPEITAIREQLAEVVRYAQSPEVLAMQKEFSKIKSSIQASVDLVNELKIGRKNLLGETD